MRKKLFSLPKYCRKQLIVLVSIFVIVSALVRFLSGGSVERLDYLGVQSGQDSAQETADLVVWKSHNDSFAPQQLVLSQDQLTKQNKPILDLKKPEKSKSVTRFFQTTEAFRQYQPQYAVVTPHQSNYGDRFSQDAYGKPVSNIPIVVLHETVGSAQSAINLFRNNHPNDSQQVSYHALVTLDGTVIYLVPPDKRAFGAGNSEFRGDRGVETVKTNPKLPSSVNNFAYHVSLETPSDGRGNKRNRRSHSGYTESQYKSLAWLIAQSNIPNERITTHREVDRAGYKIDPRSFDFARFFQVLNSYRQPLVSRVIQ